MKIINWTLFILGFLCFLDLLMPSGLIRNSSFIVSLADSTGGIPTDIMGGLGGLFFGLSMIISFAVFKKKKEKSGLFMAIGGAVLGIAAFFLAFSEVI